MAARSDVSDSSPQNFWEKRQYVSEDIFQKNKGGQDFFKSKRERSLPLLQHFENQIHKAGSSYPVNFDRFFL